MRVSFFKKENASGQTKQCRSDGKRKRNYSVMKKVRYMIATDTKLET